MQVAKEWKSTRRQGSGNGGGHRLPGFTTDLKTTTMAKIYHALAPGDRFRTSRKLENMSLPAHRFHLLYIIARTRTGMSTAASGQGYQTEKRLPSPTPELVISLVHPSSPDDLYIENKWHKHIPSRMRNQFANAITDDKEQNRYILTEFLFPGPFIQNRGWFLFLP